MSYSPTPYQLAMKKDYRDLAIGVLSMTLMVAIITTFASFGRYQDEHRKYLALVGGNTVYTTGTLDEAGLRRRIVSLAEDLISYCEKK